MLPDLGGLINALNSGGVRFVVVGGIAVAAHQVIRATEDLDLVPDPSEGNLDELANVLVALDARLLLNPERGIDTEVRSGLHSGRNLTVTTALGSLDVVQRLPGVPSFAELDAGAWDVTIFDTPFRVCSREHLIAMKRARGSALDQADLARLLEDTA